MDAIDRYFADHHIDPLRSQQADVVLGLLHIGTPESMDMVAEIMGKPITRCPPAVPPWPPKPVVKKDRSERRLAFVGENLNLPTSKLFQDFRLLKKGMTEVEIRARGISLRDLRHWAKKGLIAWSD